MSAAAPTATAESETAAASPAKKSKKKLVIILILVLIILGLGGGGGFYYMQLKKAKAAAEGGANPEAAEEKSHDEVKAPTYMSLDPFVANLNDRGAERMAQIGIAFELADVKEEAKIKSFIPAIRNNILMLIASKTSEQLQTFEGKQQLADEIRRAALAPMGNRLESDQEKKSAAIRGVQFSSFIIQ